MNTMNGRRVEGKKAVCRDCGGSIVWLVSRNGKNYKVNAAQAIGTDYAVAFTADFHNCDPVAKASYIAKPAAKFDGVATFVRAAAERSGAKRFVIKLRISAATTLAMSFKAERGVIYLSDGTYDGQYYGAVQLSDGTFRSGRNDLSAGMLAAITAFANDPAKAAETYGLVTGECMFCSKALDDERSRVVGYGPTCAKKFGLPWGEGRDSKKRSAQTLAATLFTSDDLSLAEELAQEADQVTVDAMDRAEDLDAWELGF